MTDIFDDDQEWGNDDFDDTDDEPPDPYDLAFDECGFIPGEGCQLVGTEDCEFDCPYRDSYAPTEIPTTKNLTASKRSRSQSKG